MSERFLRTEMLLGEEALEKLRNAKVLVAGVGGVGSFVVEGLIRCGVGKLVLVDDDAVAESNLNRQILATMGTIGRPKVEAMRERILSINPDVEVTMVQEFLTPDNMEKFIDENLDYVVDAIDTVTAKLAIIARAKAINIPVISSMGTGNKLHPEMLELADIAKTSVCPLAKVMRKELRARGIKKVTVCYSKEEPLKPMMKEGNNNALVGGGPVRPGNPKKQTPGSVSFVPSVAGMIIAGKVVRDLTERE